MVPTDERVSSKGSGVTEGVRRTTGVTPLGANLNPPDPEVVEMKPRRKFTAQYKLRILEEADACTEPGQIGALLRREGLYSSNLNTWRRQRKEGQLAALGAKKRGRKPIPKNPLADRVVQLEKENRRLQNQLKQARTIIDVQKKISEILGIPQPEQDSDGSNS
jgi:transposase-like protein